MATITTPAGNKVRSQSRRRFVVVIDYTAPDREPFARIDKRSDNIETARSHARGRNYFGTDGRKSVASVIDTVTGQVV